MPTNKKNTFILNDESQVNSYGFKLLNSGLNKTRFEANPVLLFGHDSNNVIGKWNELIIENGLLLSEPDFDLEDEAATKIQKKVAGGYIKGCSVGLMIDDIIMLQDASGKYVPTVTSWTLLEASIVAIPSNQNCLKLYDKSGIELSAQQVQLNIQKITNNNFSQKMKEYKLSNAALAALGLDAQATAESVEANILALKKTLDDAAIALQLQKQTAAEQLVNDAILDGQLGAKQKESMIAFALVNLEAAKQIIDAAPKKQSLAAQVQSPKNGDASDWNFKQWQKEDPKGLEAMRLNDAIAYEKLKATYAQSIAK